MKSNFKKFISCFLILTLFVSSTGIYESVVSAKENQGETKVKYLSNQALFDELEKNGYKLEDIFTKKEIEQYKAEDQTRAGKTKYVETGDSTSTLYLSSAYTKTIAALGASAATAIGGLIGLSGGAVVAVGGASFGTFLGSIASANVNTDKGIYIKFKSQKDAAGQYNLVAQEWGYQ